MFQIWWYLVQQGIVWYSMWVGIVYIYYHAKFGTPNLKTGRVTAVSNLVVFWYSREQFGIVWYGILCGYYLDLLPCKIWNSYLEKWPSYSCFCKVCKFVPKEKEKKKKKKKEKSISIIQITYLRNGSDLNIYQQWRIRSHF